MPKYENSVESCMQTVCKKIKKNEAAVATVQAVKRLLKYLISLFYKFHNLYELQNIESKPGFVKETS